MLLVQPIVKVSEATKVIRSNIFRRILDSKVGYSLLSITDWVGGVWLVDIKLGCLNASMFSGCVSVHGNCNCRSTQRICPKLCTANGKMVRNKNGVRCFQHRPTPDDIKLKFIFLFLLLFCLELNQNSIERASKRKW